MFERKSSYMFTGCRYTHGVNLFRNTHSNTVSLFAEQGPAKTKGFEIRWFVTHRCRSSIYELAVISELALNEALGMKRIFSIIME